MAAFECDRCGKCCVSLGPHILIERQLNDRDYYCRCNIDNSIFLAHVDREYCDEIADEFEVAGNSPAGPEKKPCVFLRKDRQGDGALCTIYSTRPKICMDFRCYRMLIYNRAGNLSGRVIGKNTLRSEDTALNNLWNERVAPVPYGDTAAWIAKVTALLAEQSYRAEVAE